MIFKINGYFPQLVPSKNKIKAIKEIVKDKQKGTKKQKAIRPGLN